MEKSTVMGVLLILTLFFAATTLILWMKVDSLSSNIVQLSKAVNDRDIVIQNANSNITYANTVIASMRSNITQRNGIIALLNQRLNETEANLENTSATLSQREEEMANLTSQIDSVKNSVETLNSNINDSMKWFRDNSIMPLSLSQDYSSLKSDCVLKDGNDVTVNLGCAPNTMKNAFGFNYRSDLTRDRLYSLDEMVANSGGDCADFSLFLKAFLASVKKDYSSSDSINIIGWENDPGSGNWFYITPKKQWGYKDAKAHDFGNLKDLTPYMVCYITEFDEANNTKIGHCIVALSSLDKISGYTDLYNLEGSELFEPQTGEYMGKVGGNITICREGDKECENAPESAMMVITGSDLYNFADSEWSSYGMDQDNAKDFISRLNNLKD
jgi:hypothetical protein